jgi:hypothetical protein
LVSLRHPGEDAANTAIVSAGGKLRFGHISKVEGATARKEKSMALGERCQVLQPVDGVEMFDNRESGCSKRMTTSVACGMRRAEWWF